MTFTIAVSVPDAGLLGAATASRSLAVGAGVLGVRAGVGLVVSQAYTNRALRRYALDRLELGHSPEEIVATLPEVDPHPELRQVAVLNQAGEFATHTGEVCTGDVATRFAAGAVLVGNLLTSPDVMDAMLHSFEQQTPARTPSELAEQLVRSLHAGDRAGGDRRGRQSAAVLVAHDAVTTEGLAADDIDLRADDHASPVDELHRLLKLYRHQ